MTAFLEHPLKAFVAKLERRGALPHVDKSALLDLPVSTIVAKPHGLVIEEGSANDRCLFVLAGVVSRQKKIHDSDQIVAIGIAGDAVELQSFWFDTYDHSIVAHKDSAFASIEREALANACSAHPLLAKVLWHDSLVDSAIFRQWTLNIGHRRASDRLLHLFLETLMRLRAQGAVDGDSFEFPFTQAEIASMSGLSLVHLNKTLKALQRSGTITIDGRMVSMHDPAAIATSVGFDPTYLHLTQPPLV